MVNPMAPAYFTRVTLKGQIRSLISRKGDELFHASILLLNTNSKPQ